MRTTNTEQLEKIGSGRGFIAALDQSGGSSAKALALYGIPEGSYSGEDEMFQLMHEMRARVLRSHVFNGDRVLGAILFENTIGRQVAGKLTGDYLWDVKKVVPFLKIDKGLAPEMNGVQTMKPIPDLAALLDRAVQANMFGTKMRSVIKVADDAGVKAIVDQQFEVARQVLAAGLVPILEPEVDIYSPSKKEAEQLLKSAITAELAALPAGQQVMLKISIPDVDNFYSDLQAHPKVLRVVALSGGYHRDEADQRLARNHGLIASFSRALLEGLTVQQSPEEFDTTLDASIESIYQASLT